MLLYLPILSFLVYFSVDAILFRRQCKDSDLCFGRGIPQILVSCSMGMASFDHGTSQLLQETNRGPC